MARSPEREDLLIPGPAGVLEALLETPSVASDERVAVICHPHPLYQGTMLNKVVHTLARTFNDLGAPALRFNFRGVGRSAGRYDDGNGEVEDLLAVVGYVRNRWPRSAVCLAGFSFGAVIAARAAARANAACLVTVAPAVNILGRHLDEVPAMPWLIVHGDADEIVPVGAVRDWVAAHQPGPTLHEMAGAGHFFHGELVALRRLVTEQLQAIGV